MVKTSVFMKTLNYALIDLKVVLNGIFGVVDVEVESYLKGKVSLRISDGSLIEVSETRETVEYSPGSLCKRFDKDALMRVICIAVSKLEYTEERNWKVSFNTDKGLFKSYSTCENGMMNLILDF